MVNIVCGEKGKGKTKVILEKANEAVKTSGGKPVLDKIIQVADKYSVDVILSLSVKSEDVPEEYKHNVLVSL